MWLMERAEQLRVVEALILASPEPISAARVGRITPECNAALARDLIRELNELYQKQDRAFEIWDIAGGYQVRTRAEFSGYLQQLHKQRPLRLSRPALETLSIVAYKQPVGRAEIERIRGVQAGEALRGLLERGLLKVVGRSDQPGRPLLYGTTDRFLTVFGLKDLKDLPTHGDLKRM
jgi:segregation and condensation protein B